MKKIDVDAIRAQARQEIADENYRALVEIEKDRLREHAGKSLFRKLLDKSPYMIVRRPSHG